MESSETWGKVEFHNRFDDFPAIFIASRESKGIRAKMMLLLPFSTMDGSFTLSDCCLIRCFLAVSAGLVAFGNCILAKPNYSRNAELPPEPKHWLCHAIPWIRSLNASNCIRFTDGNTHLIPMSMQAADCRQLNNHFQMKYALSLNVFFLFYTRKCIQPLFI